MTTLSNDAPLYGRITIDGTTPDQIPAARSGSLIIYNPSGNGTVYLGDSSVATSTGLPIPAGTSITIDTVSANKYYLIGTALDEVAWLVD